MAEGEVNRRLAAIVAADIAGYSRLVSADEEGTYAAQRAHRAELIDPRIAEYHGRIANTAGDSILIEFPSVVDALRCCLDVQRGMEERNADLPEDRRIRYRIGINLGDVIDEDGDLLGAGVNVAARLEGLAEPGGICLSRAARDQVRDLLDLTLEDLGEVEVKNIARPVRVFRVMAEGDVAAPLKQRAPAWWKYAAAAVVALAILAGGGFWWWQQPEFEPADPAKYAFELPEKPSIAVLPFDNLSGDESQEHLADGLSETVTSALAAIPEMFVIARNSTFTYKGKAVKVQKVAEELGVRYVLEGSLQQDGDRLRVTAQLIDALNGRHLWAERFDRKIADLFAVQDEITLHIVSALQVKLTDGKRAALGKGSTTNLEAWSHYVKGRALFFRVTKEDNAAARELFQKALAVDPQFLWAQRGIGWTHANDARSRWSESRARSFKLAEEAVDKATAINPEDAGVHALRGYLALLRGKYDDAIAAGRKAIALSPNNPDPYAVLAISTYYSGDFPETIALVKKAMRLYPHHPTWYFTRIGTAYMMLGQYDDAISALKTRLADNPSRLGSMVDLATAYSMAGQMEQAEALVSQILKAEPDASLKRAARSHRFKNRADLKRILDALHKAGLPENPPLKLPDKPSIAVLPFDNLSGDANQEFLADGISENIISALSTIREMFVIARNSSFTYKGKAVKVQKVARDLGVRYILEGSVQHDAGRLRVTAQLIDAVKGHHLWSERYDRTDKDLFAVQDEITLQIVSSLQVKLTEGEQARLKEGTAGDLRAWEYRVTGSAYFRRFTKEDNKLARKWFEKAIAQDPDYIYAWIWLGWTHFMDARRKWSDDPKESFRLGQEAVDRVFAAGKDVSGAHGLQGALYLLEGKHDLAIAEQEKAIQLSPNSADQYAVLAISKYYSGNFKETVALTKKAMRLHPHHPNWFLYRIGVAYMMLGEYKNAISTLKTYADSNPKAVGRNFTLATAYSMAGRVDEARKLVSETLAKVPTYSLAEAAVGHRFKDPAHLKRIIDALRAAGVPEKAAAKPSVTQ